MKQILFMMFLLISNVGISQNYYFLINESETNKYVVESNDPFNTPTNFEVRLNDIQVSIESEINNTIVDKPDWVYIAQNVYTNGLNAVGFNGAWTNMNVTFEMIGAALLQAIGSNLASGNIDQANLIGTWKGLIKDTYESLLKYSSNYGITDMRLFPYDSPYIYSNNVTRSYIEYNGYKYYILNN